MMRGPRLLQRLSPRLISAAVGLASLAALLSLPAVIGHPPDKVVLPNGMIIKRGVDPAQPYSGDLFTKDGATRLARDLEGICFNDRYVWVYSYDRSQSGLFDAEKDARLDGLSHDEAFTVSGLGGNRQACNGYYTGMVGPGLLYDGNTSPHLPSCNARNIDNPTLQDRSWFDRPCQDDQ
ncbi:MAG: hypothetical protein IOC92_07450 [Rhodobacter sp.]|nr:hypothetical protein [Rhodobacter sp.]MCA3459822.1 hypothetical protein [Rhodobacter sp.]MCA3463537.1 hypothetical protein [Rhodobacter sp.]MCA3468227.1 hypothetical protein [Rhodobacter sp.]MCA3469994.1 hypothetical protein [Rhodobacter sp.]